MVAKSPDSSAAGYAWLADRAGIGMSGSPPTVSVIGRSRRSEPGREIYPPHYAPAESVQEHLRFALAHEDLNLELMARLFAKTGDQFIVQWLRAEPTSSYARRAGFFYEWLTGRTIAEHDRVAAGNYVDALDPGKFLAATDVEQNRRWRVNDNLPGTRAFCPLVRLGTQASAAGAVDFGLEVQRLIEHFGEDLIARSVNWLSVKESRASFLIEREADKEDRIHRFARALAEHSGKLEDPLGMQSLRLLQDAILGDAKTTFQRGLRRSPVFVGHSERFEQVVDYLAPHHDQIPDMLEGLRTFAQRTAINASTRTDEKNDNLRSVLRATVLSFGFVYIHPMADGNGRISRFLINDTLQRDGVLARPLILPVSAIISANTRERQRYDETLELVSKPLMAQLHGRYRFDREKITTFEDGVRSNLLFDGWEDAAPSWRYLNLTRHAGYLADVIRRSMSEGIADEARYLQRFDQARAALARLFEGRDEDYIRIIRGIVDHGSVSKGLCKTYPEILGVPEDAQAIERAVLDAFKAADADLVEQIGRPRGN